MWTGQPAPAVVASRALKREIRGLTEAGKLENDVRTSGSTLDTRHGRGDANAKHLEIKFLQGLYVVQHLSLI